MLYFPTKKLDLWLLLVTKIVAGKIRLGVLLTLALSLSIADANDGAHLGVSNCASSTCHGSSLAFKDSSILRNEFRTWYEQDPHALAYKTLLNPRSQEIARKLGLESAHRAPICLACHTDHVATNKRGEDFKLEDGVGCEACHGGSENYLNSHTNDNHAGNLNAGLRKTEDPAVRGELCVSCHIGNEQSRQITHTIMGAGHPRLSFELNTFSSIQPAHYSVDLDYIERKGNVNTLQTWAVGQVIAASQLLKNVSSLPRSGLFPELSHMDCLACHQGMKKLTWSADRISQLPSGALRYQEAHLLMSYRIAQVTAVDLAADLLTAIKLFLHSASNPKDMPAGVARTLAQLQRLQTSLETHPIQPAQGLAMVNELVTSGIENEHRSYASAEQLAMGLNSLLHAVSSSYVSDQLKQKLVTQMNHIFDTVADPEQYKPEQLISHLKNIKRLSIDPE
jgi:hypothetical protein